MKKLLLTLTMGVLVSIGTFAQGNLYMVGSGGPGLNWSAPGLTLTPTDNKYTFTFTANSQPEFKVSVNNSSDWDAANTGYNAGCLGVSDNQQNGIEANKEYECTIGGNKNNIKAPAKDTYILNIEYRNGKYYLTLNTESGLAPTVTYPEKVYVPGSSAGWGVNENYVLTRQNETLNAQGQIIYTGTLSTLSGEFKIAEDPSGWSGINMGAGATATVPLDTDIECVGGSQTNFNVTGTLTNVTVTFTYAPEGTSSLRLTTEGSSEPAYPDSLYMIGTFTANGTTYNWSETDGYEVSAQETGIFVFKDIKFTSAGHFAFTSQMGSWDIIKANRYAPATQDQSISVGDTQKMQFAVDQSWSIGAGSYSFTVNVKDMTVSVESGSEDVVTPLYIVGDSVNGNDTWSVADDTNIMTYSATTGLYTWSGETLAKKFKFNDGSWNGNYNLGAVGSDTNIEIGTALSLSNSGQSNNIIVEDGYYIVNPVVTLDLSKLTVTVAGTLTKSDYVPEVIYLMGGNDWNNGIALNKTSDGIYSGSGTLQPSDEDDSEGEVKVKLKTDDNSWYGPAADEENVVWTSGKAVVLNMNSAASGDWYLTDFEGGKAEATVDWNAKTLSLTLTPNSSSGVNAIEAAPAAEVIYNLQGVRVNKAEKGIYIINGKKVLVK